MTRLGLGLVGLGLVGAGAWSGWESRQTPVPALETLTLTRPVVRAAPALCPWRKPSRDMQEFFPGADGYKSRLMVLSGLRVPILQRLGPGATLDSNVLYTYSVYGSRAVRGTVLVQRVAGEHGVIEVVVGVDGAGRMTGLRLQRLREPDAVARALADPAWRHALCGKTGADAWRLGGDVPDVPPPARETARTVLGAVRALLIEYDVARQHGQG